MTPGFAKDFIQLQSEIETMPKDKSGYGYKYTDLDTIISNLKPLLKKHNIGFSQILNTMENGITGITTLVMHNSGDSFTGFVAIPEIQVGKANNAQNIGAAITYFKRYALSAVFGISSDEDIDCSSQKIESHNQASETAPTVKASSNKSSVKTSKTETKKTTSNADLKKHLKELSDIMVSEYSDGAPIFTENEKEVYRNLVKNGGILDAIKKAKEEKEKRINTPFEPTEEDLARELEA